MYILLIYNISLKVAQLVKTLVQKVDWIASLDPILPVEEVLPLGVHQLEGLLAQHDEGRQHKEYLKECSFSHKVIALKLKLYRVSHLLVSCEPGA